MVLERVGLGFKEGKKAGLKSLGKVSNLVSNCCFLVLMYLIMLRCSVSICWGLRIV